MRQWRGQRLGLVGIRIALLLMSLVGCQSIRVAPASRLCDEARGLLQTERYGDGLRKVEQALQHDPAGSDLHYRARLLKAELQVANREARAAQATLDFDLPQGDRWDLDRGRQYMLRGHAFILLGERDAAAESLEKAAAAARRANSALLAAEVELRRGSLFVRAGDYDGAAFQFRHALDFGQQQKDPQLRLAATGNLGFLDLRAHRYEDAIDWFERTLVLARQVGARVSEARALGNLGSAYYRLGDYDRALEFFIDAEKRFGELGNRFEQQIWRGNQGNVQLSLRDFAAAAASYGQALAISRSLDNSVWTATWLSNLAQTAIETRDWEAAEGYNQEALALKQKAKDPQAAAYSLNNLARIAAGRKDYRQAHETFAKVIAASADPVTSLEARAGMARALIEAGDPRRAEQALQAALSAVDKQRSQLIKDESKLSYFASRIGLYQDYVEFLMSEGRPEEALAVAEASRARILSDQFQQRVAPHRWSAADLKRAARNRGEVLLSYWLSPKRSYVWAVTADSVSAFPLPPENEIRKMVTAYSDVIQAQRDPLEAEHPAGRRLSEALLQPLQHLLPASGKVTLVPDGALHALNFETLLRFDSPHPKYLGENVSFTITPWLGALAEVRAQGHRAREDALIIGNPEAGTDGYPRLEFAGAEITAVRQSLAGRSQEILEGQRATANLYRDSRPGRFSLIHFAAHAAANRENPLESAIILSGAPRESRLTAREVVAVPLTADLVTVSACRSGVARTYSGEGMVGLSWAFLRAGARNVIASLWNVNDRSTALLMSRLYQELARGAPPAYALHAAKLELMRSRGPYRKPYYWAPFQIYAAGSR